MKYNFPISDIREFTEEEIKNINEAKFAEAKEDSIMPVGAYLSSPFVEYINVDGKMKLPKNHEIKGVIIKNNDDLIVTDPNYIKKGDLVLIADKSDPKYGIFRDTEIFDEFNLKHKNPMYASSAETYKKLFHLMSEVKEKGGKIAWVLGPAVVFDYDTRLALSDLVNAGYVQLLLAGNAMTTHDLEGGFLNTALGQNIYTQESVPNGHYNHLDLINEARHYGSLKEFVETGKVKDGFIKNLVENDIPIVLCGSIRDDGPLPEVFHNVHEGLHKMRESLEDFDLIITLATLLHSVSATQVAPSYRVKEGKIYGTPVFSIDITDYATNSVIDERQGFLVDSIVTNVQDFCVNARNNLIKFDGEGRTR